MASESDLIVMDNPDAIQAARLLALLSACRLECKGMKHSSRKSMVQVVRTEFGLKGSKAKVTERFAVLLRQQGILSARPPA